MELPDYCLRGIRVFKWILPDGKVSGEAFEPDGREPRADGLIDTSIVWEDDNTVLDFCFKKCKDTFTHGAVRLSKKILDQLISYNDMGRFAYERRKVKGNDHHGNLLFDQLTNAKSRRLLQGSLAFFSSKALFEEKK